MTKKKKSYVPVAKIKNALRRIHLHDKQRRKAKERAKIDAALFKCEAEECNVAIYEGQSSKNFDKLAEKWTELELIKGKIELDHKNPVVEPRKGMADWNTYIERLWCAADQYSALCSDCHKAKTAEEAGERKEAGTLKRSKK